MCCSHVCWMCVFVVTATAMAANSPSIFMRVALTAEQRWKVLLLVCLESRDQSNASHTLDNLLSSQKCTFTTASWFNWCVCMCVWNWHRQIEPEMSVSSVDQCQIQTCKPYANNEPFCFSCRVSYIIRDLSFFRTTLPVTTFFYFAIKS